MGPIRLVRRVVFVGSAALSVAAGLAVQFTSAVLVDVRHASTGELLHVLTLTAAPVAAMAVWRLGLARPSKAARPLAVPAVTGPTKTRAGRPLGCE